MIEVMLEAIQVSLISTHRIVILRELDVERYLAILIGSCEAESILMRLNHIDMPRPLTHDLIVNMLEAMNAQLLYIYINSLTDNIFYARLFVDVEGREIEIDARPSDAIAIAVRLDVPIYVAEAVMTEAAVEPEADLIAVPSEDEDLDVFRDFLSSLGDL